MLSLTCKFVVPAGTTIPAPGSGTVTTAKIVPYKKILGDKKAKDLIKEIKSLASSVTTRDSRGMVGKEVTGIQVAAEGFEGGQRALFELLRGQRWKENTSPHQFTVEVDGGTLLVGEPMNWRDGVLFTIRALQTGITLQDQRDSEPLAAFLKDLQGLDPDVYVEDTPFSGRLMIDYVVTTGRKKLIGVIDKHFQKGQGGWRWIGIPGGIATIRDKPALNEERDWTFKLLI